MANSPLNADRLYEEEQLATRTKRKAERRERLKSFLLLLALIVLTVAAAAGLARLVNENAIRL
ncbi:MAG: hypothetical protein SFV51_15120 [Bryobacteraceae bacterium]|nr:hypothetical protein [Bryobacteraceae bacterium]